MKYIIFGFFDELYKSIDFVKMHGCINEFLRISVSYSSEF